jgi:hypothetical protein
MFRAWPVACLARYPGDQAFPVIVIGCLVVAAVPFYAKGETWAGTTRNRIHNSERASVTPERSEECEVRWWDVDW